MRGSRKNYGKAHAGRKITVRLYGADRLYVEQYAKMMGCSMADILIEMLRERTICRDDLHKEAAEKYGRHTKQTGRPQKHSATKVATWRKIKLASIATTASHFKISAATVKRMCAQIREEK